MWCLSNRSATNALMMDLTEPQVMLRTVTAYKRPAMRPTIMINDIDGVFNCVVHERLIDILTHYWFPNNLVRCIAAFNSNRQIHMAFDGESEKPTPFQAGLRKAFPHSRILFVIYSSALDNKAGVRITAYVANEVARVGVSF